VKEFKPANPAKAKKYVIEEEFFFIYPAYVDCYSTKEHITYKDEIISYSNNDNKIVEVHEITDTYIKTRYYPDWYPLVITGQHKVFYSDSEIRKRATEYKKLLADHIKLYELYKRIKEEYESFKKNTGLDLQAGQHADCDQACHAGLIFTDKRGNNILTNHDFSDFRIIDIASIAHDRGPFCSANTHVRKFPSPLLLMAGVNFQDPVHPEMTELGYDKEMSDLVEAVPWPTFDYGGPMAFESHDLARWISTDDFNAHPAWLPEEDDARAPDPSPPEPLQVSPTETERWTSCSIRKEWDALRARHIAGAIMSGSTEDSE
jgi:hypothetical protein